MTNIGERIRYYRNLLRLSQAFVADQLGIGRPSYTKMERNAAEFSASQLRTLANLFRVQVDDFFEPLKIDSSRKASLQGAQFRLTSADFRINDAEATETIFQSITDLLLWSTDPRNKEELKRRQKKAEETYAMFKNVSEAIEYCNSISFPYATQGGAVDIIHMAMQEFGLWLSWNSFGAFSGIYLPMGKEISAGVKLPLPVVGIHSGHPSERQRFSSAHELGHHLFGQRGKFGSPTKPVTDQDEKEANQFASELLMDPRIVKDTLKEFTQIYQNRLSMPSIVLLVANHLQVSYSALMRKLIHQLGVIPAEERDALLNAKVREMQRNLASGKRSPAFKKKQFEECEEKLKTTTDIYKTDPKSGAPRHPQDIRFLQDYCYVAYLDSCKQAPPMDSSKIFQEVVKAISSKYPVYA